MHRILKQALRDAVRFDVIHRNPADAVQPPKIDRQPLQTYDVAQTATLLALVKASRLFVPVVIGVLCGVRRGAIVALQWRHVEFERGQLSVSQSVEQTKAGIRLKQPKSGKSRTVELSATVLEVLRQHRLRQAEEMLRIGVRLTDDTFIYITSIPTECSRGHS